MRIPNYHRVTTLLCLRTLLVVCEEQVSNQSVLCRELFRTSIFIAAKARVVMILGMTLEMVRSHEGFPATVYHALVRSLSSVLTSVFLQVTPSGELLATAVIFTVKCIPTVKSLVGCKPILGIE